MTEIAVPLADGLEEIEAVTIIDVLRRAKLKVSAIGVTGRTVRGSHEISLEADRTVEEVKGEPLFDAVVLPGGEPGTTNLAGNNWVIETLERHHKQNRLIGAICAAPRILADLGFLDDRPATSHPSVRDQMNNARYFEEPVVQTKELVTARGPGTALPFSLSLVSLLKDADTATKLADDMMYEPVPEHYAPDH